MKCNEANDACLRVLLRRPFFLPPQAEHHARALNNIPGISFYKDEKRGRVGMLTTLQIKHAMCTLLNAMLRSDSVRDVSQMLPFFLCL
jgi:hypothetical protein